MLRAFGARYRRLIRAAAAFLVFLLVVSALVQGLGRLGMWLLDDLEGAANAWLDGSARLDGLAGGWDGLNPVASARRIELAAGRLEQVTVELDVLESIRRNRLVLERLLVEASELAVERTGAGWRLAGMEAAATGFDLLRLLRDIDEVRFNGRLSVAGAPREELLVRVLGVNRDGAHDYDFTVSSPQCKAPCRLQARWRALDRAWSGRPEQRYLELAGGFFLPGPFVGWLGLPDGLRLNAEGRWLERGESGGGAVEVRLGRVGLPGGVVGSLAAGLRGAYLDGRREGRLENLSLSAAGAGVRLGPVHFRTRPEGAEFWTGRLALGELTDFLAVALGGVQAARAWLAALRPGGELLNVHTAVGPEGLSYAATFDALRLDPHRGVPWVRDAMGEIVGYERAALLTLNSEAMRVGIADVFTDRWRWENLQGNLHAWFGDGYVGMRVPWFRLETHGTRLSGSFSLARPEARADQRVAALIDADVLGVEEARTYIPYHLSDGIRTWLHEGPRSGRMVGPRIAYQGQVHTQPDDRSRRLEMRARITAGEVRYHPDWPLVSEAEGFFELAGSETFAEVDSARTLSAGIRDSRLRIGDGGAFAEVALQGEVDLGGGLDFVRGSPLAEWMPFVVPEWDGSGRLGLIGTLYVPIDESLEEPVDCRLALEVADANLVMPDYRLEVRHLNGPAGYRCPHYLSAESLRAELFGRPAGIAAEADEDSIDLRFQGIASETDVYRLIDATDPGLAAGEAPFDATLVLAVDDGVSSMTVTSDLVGLGIDLPGEFGKAADAPAPVEIGLQFLEEYVAVDLRYGDLARIRHQLPAADADALALRGRAPSSRFDVLSSTPASSSGPRDQAGRRLDALTTKVGDGYGLAAPGENPAALDCGCIPPDCVSLPVDGARPAAAPGPCHRLLQGWLHVDEVPLRGAIGVRGAPPPVGAGADEVVVSGHVGRADVNEWLTGTGDAPIPVPWRLADVRLERMTVETQEFENLMLNGASRGETMTLEFASSDLTGRLRSTGEEPLELDFASIRLPEPDGEGDPLDVSVIERVPDADVTIDSLTIGEEDFGAWSFTLRGQPDGLLAGDLKAHLKGTEVSAPQGVFWNAATNRSSGAVRLTMEDLAEVLPQWDYAPSLEAETAELHMNASWPGSPLNVEVNGLRGDVSFRAKNGSFVDVSGGGALRIMALLNINTVFRRMSLNFKDVTARGTSFDTVQASTRFDDGLLTFVEPAKVKGSGSDFKFGGSVNLVDGIMNGNEMIVTLPVSDSLPWYAVYISLANPVAAAAVLAGQQVLKKQIKQMSSAKYRISGSWEDPEVKLVGIWNDDLGDFDELTQEQESPALPDETRVEGGR